MCAMLIARYLKRGKCDLAERNECTMQMRLVHDTLIRITDSQFSKKFTF